MPSLTAVVALASAAPVLLASAEPSAEVGKCAFENEPIFPGYFWDPSCQEGVEGCLADGVNMECRFCGGGSNYSVPCPPSSCHFPNDPFVPYFWDPTCEMGKVGCWADGVHAQCRFCGDHPFTDVKCPEELSAAPNGATCTFTENEPTTPSFWDPGCEMGGHGCNADGIHVQCRFCGKGVYANVACPASEVCSFANEPSIPYFWDSECAMGGLGCMADGLHAECRFCGKRPFENIPCPGPIEPPKDQCTFPLNGEPTMGYYWEEACESGKLGCWADGMHAQCRFCGGGVYEEIPCPSPSAPDQSTNASASTGTGGAATKEKQYDAVAASQAFMRKSSLASSARDISPNLSNSTNSSKDADGEKLLDGAATVGSGLGALIGLLASVAASAASSD